jgi:hypothetical protein
MQQARRREDTAGMISEATLPAIGLTRPTRIAIIAACVGASSAGKLVVD